jgi:hypothetical protein
LALPPDTTNEVFLREVDENLRRDRARDFAKRYGKWLIAGLALFLLASGGWIYWKYRQQQAAERQVEQLASIYRDIGTGKLDQAAKQIDPLAREGTPGVRASAMFTSAALALEKRDTKSALATFRAIAADEDLPKPYRDLALLRQTALEFDSLKPEEVIGRLEPLAKPGTAWFGTAGDMTAAALYKQGKRAEAGRLYAAIAKDDTVPDAIRARSIQIASSLGVDASSAMPGLAQ